jgi:hypothetical protein
MQCKFCGKEKGIVLSMPSTGFCECSRLVSPAAWSWEFEDEWSSSCAEGAILSSGIIATKRSVS